MSDYASAKPREPASRKYTPEKNPFKALWKVSYRESFTILLGLCFENKTRNADAEKPYCFYNLFENTASERALRFVFICNSGIFQAAVYGFHSQHCLSTAENRSKHKAINAQYSLFPSFISTLLSLRKQVMFHVLEERMNRDLSHVES